MLALHHLRDRLPISDFDVGSFHCPPGWLEERIENSRRPKKRWVQRDEAGELIREFDRRTDLEAELEADAHAAIEAAAGREEEDGAPAPWLGQLTSLGWQISPKALPAALEYLLDGLVRRGLAKRVEPEVCKRQHAHYVVCNQYERGEPFPRAVATSSKRGGSKAAEEEEEPEVLADIEIERLRNIERNKEILRQLGLA